MKLEPQHIRVLELIQRDKNEDGWATVSKQLYPILSANMPTELVEWECSLDKRDYKIRLTDEGQKVYDAIKLAKQWGYRS